MLEKLEFTLLGLHNKTTSINNNYKTNSLLRMNSRFLFATTKIAFKTVDLFKPHYKLVKSRGTGMQIQQLFVIIIFFFLNVGRWLKTPTI